MFKYCRVTAGFSFFSFFFHLREEGRGRSIFFREYTVKPLGVHVKILNFILSDLTDSHTSLSRFLNWLFVHDDAFSNSIWWKNVWLCGHFGPSRWSISEWRWVGADGAPRCIRVSNRNVWWTIRSSAYCY